MDAGVMMVSGAVFVLVGFVLLGGPTLLADWSRKRGQAAIDRQIALTDALDGQLGPIVAPGVKKPLFGPWEIRIAVPLHQSATVARILSVVDEVFQDVQGAGSRSYRILLSAKPDALQETRAPRTPEPTERWAGCPIAAA
jgi:hypothetical protein